GQHSFPAEAQWSRQETAVRSTINRNFARPHEFGGINLEQQTRNGRNLAGPNGGQAIFEDIIPATEREALGREFMQRLNNRIQVIATNGSQTHISHALDSISNDILSITRQYRNPDAVLGMTARGQDILDRNIVMNERTAARMEELGRTIQRGAAIYRNGNPNQITSNQFVNALQEVEGMLSATGRASLHRQNIRIALNNIQPENISTTPPHASTSFAKGERIGRGAGTRTSQAAPGESLPAPQPHATPAARAQRVSAGANHGLNLGLGLYGLYESVTHNDWIRAGIDTANVGVGAAAAFGKNLPVIGNALMLADGTYQTVQDFRHGGIGRGLERAAGSAVVVGTGIGIGMAVTAGVLTAPAWATGLLVTGAVIGTASTVNNAIQIRCMLSETQAIYAQEDQRFAAQNDSRHIVTFANRMLFSGRPEENEAKRREFAARGAKFDTNGYFDLNDRTTRNIVSEALTQEESRQRRIFNENNVSRYNIFASSRTHDRRNEADYSLRIISAARQELNNYSNGRRTIEAQRAAQESVQQGQIAAITAAETRLDRNRDGSIDGRDFDRNGDGKIDLADYANSNGVFDRNSLAQMRQDIGALDTLNRPELARIRESLNTMATEAERELTRQEAAQSQTQQNGR
ncbi:MAG: hypothetical protein KGJ06_07220, partial [Pseudomonadota bacterium]|nr:hypothetical protein [Pseudomonadota bacterium]